ncbi:MAG: nuclear transport factor 2 family protein [Candidatus Dormibacteraceae bacterium]
MQTSISPQAFVDQITARNFDGVAGILSPDATARMLLPRRVEEIVGAGAIARQFEDWFGAADPFEVFSADVQPVGARWLLRWRFRLCRDGRSMETLEQLAFANVRPDGIYRLDLLCSGFMPDV